MLSRFSLFTAVPIILSLLVALAIPTMSFAQNNPPASSAPAFAPKQAGGTVPDSAPKFSSAGITAKLASISKKGGTVTVSLMVQNNNSYPVLTSIIHGGDRFTIVDNQGHFVKLYDVSGIPQCNFPQKICANPEDTNFGSEKSLQIDSGSAAIANMIFSGSEIGDTVTLTGTLAVIPWAEDSALGGKQSQPRKGRAVNVTIPLISLQ